MSRGLAKIGKIITSPISLIIGDKATSALLAIAAAIPGPHQPFAAAAAVAFTTFSQLAAPKPPARGSATNVIIAAEPPRPYMIGESFSGGVLRHQVAYGETLKKVENPFLWQVKVFSGVGPVEEIVEEQFDFEPIGGYFTGFYDSVSQLGLRPESAALVPPYGTAPGWTTASKLSGCAAIGSNYKFDRDGKVFASGQPLHGAILKGEKVYDARLDDTYPGGDGPCRLGDESTYVYSTCPALHAGTYAYGRYQDGIKIFGIGIGAAGIDWAAIVDWANDCDANGWEAHGTIYEGGQGNDIQTQRVQNLDDICAAGGGRWLVAGALLSFDWHRPRVSLATMTDDDWLEEGGNATAVQSVRDRMNGVRPQYISPAHNWEQITADEIIGTTYREEDGQAFTQVWPLNLVKDATQAGQLAAYALTDTREIGPIEIAANQSWRFYKPGETITIDSELLGYTGQAVIMQREFDPLSFAVRLTLKSETPAKHDFALGKVAVPPPTPVIGQTAEERDQVASTANNPRGAYRIRTYVPTFPITPGDGEIVIVAFTGTLEDGRTISFPAETLTGLDQLTLYDVFWDLITEEYLTFLRPALTQMESDRYVFVGAAATSDGTDFPIPADPPPGWSGDPNYNVP
ncbi:hypothetical protein [Blastomonas sp. AAP25]|uniref:hypothetical protein n=1 Tax=Blastomonas sp. AAP25 TaxID=1523416 RepID=UPI0006B8F11D|nr:hypothetical protein [Blastomonas sp. AAP25]